MKIHIGLLSLSVFLSTALLAACGGSNDPDTGSGDASSISPDVTPPTYRYELRDQEGQASITDNVITLTSSSSDGSKQRNRLIVDTENRLTADLSITEATVDGDGQVQARVYMKLYNDTVDTTETTPENSVGEVELSVSYELPPGGSELIFSACANRAIVDDDEPANIFNGESCYSDSSPMQVGERLRIGAEFSIETGKLTIIDSGGSIDFQVPGPRYQPLERFNRVAIIARGGPSNITAEIYGVGSDNLDDDFSGGVVVGGVNDIMAFQTGSTLLDAGAEALSADELMEAFSGSYFESVDGNWDWTFQEDGTSTSGSIPPGNWVNNQNWGVEDGKLCRDFEENYPCVTVYRMRDDYRFSMDGRDGTDNLEGWAMRRIGSL